MGFPTFVADHGCVSSSPNMMIHMALDWWRRSMISDRGKKIRVSTVAMFSIMKYIPPNATCSIPHVQFWRPRILMNCPLARTCELSEAANGISWAPLEATKRKTTSKYDFLFEAIAKDLFHIISKLFTMAIKIRSKWDKVSFAFSNGCKISKYSKKSLMIRETRLH